MSGGDAPGLSRRGLFGAASLVAAAGVGTAAHSSDDYVAVPILGGIGGMVFIVCMVLGLPGIIGGIGLLQFKPWARILVIVLSVLDLFNIPFGTALGIYGLWALLNTETEQMFSRQTLPVMPRA